MGTSMKTKKTDATPAPWWAEGLPGQVVIYHRAPGRARIVAEVSRTEPGWKANAHILAAAPDLLAAAEQARAAFFMLADTAGDVPEWNKGGIAYEASRKIITAIVKAKGG
jgi:hypothetical protein